MVTLFSQLWDWQDECIEAMQHFRDQTEGEYDFSSFEIAFGGLARLEALRGPFYDSCLTALKDRMQRLSITDSAADSA
jgi:hypothetical protein